MHIFGIALFVLGIAIWGMIVSPKFRIVAVIGICALIGWLIVLSDREENERRAKAAQEQADQTKEGQRQALLWTLIRPDQIQLRDVSFSPSPPNRSQFMLTGTVKNLSNQKLGAIEINITARDCLRECETIGHADGMLVWVDIPPQEVRALPAYAVEFPHLPNIKGKFVPDISVNRIYSGDILDRWLVHR